jgi:hypothetical protein
MNHSQKFRHGVASLALALLCSTDALTQPAPTSNYTSFEVTSGKPMRIAYYAVLRKDCKPGPAPTIRVIEAPKSGTLTVRGGELTTGVTASCPNLKAPAQLLFYLARAGAVGSDHIVYAVISSDGRIDGYDVTITIKEAPKEPAAGQEKPI